MHRILLPTLPLIFGGCGFLKFNCCTTDSADSDWLSVEIDHTEQPGEYVITYSSGFGTNTCSYVAPLGDNSPSCDLQGGAVEFGTDELGITWLRSAAEQGGDISLVVTRDGEELYSSALDPSWMPSYGEGGCDCYLFDQGEIVVSF